MVSASQILTLFETLSLTERSIPSMNLDDFKSVLSKRIRDALIKEVPHLKKEILTLNFPIYNVDDTVVLYANLYKSNFIFEMDIDDETLDILNDDYKNVLVNIFDKPDYAKKYGWFRTGYYTDNHGNRGILFEPTHTEQKEDGLPPYLYHITLKEYLPSIQKKGLLPRHGNHNLVGRFFRPDRVYVLTRKEDLVKIRNSLQQSHNKQCKDEWGLPIEGKNTRKLTDYALVIIDTSKLRKGTKFYSDPEFYKGSDMAYYTTTHIPPEACKIRKSFTNF